MVRTVFLVTVAVISVLAIASAAAGAPAQMPNPYGAPINLENARKVAGGALVEARKNHWTMAVAVVDTTGHLVYFERLDDTQIASDVVAMDKARAADFYKRPTKALQDMLATGGAGLRMLGLQGAVPVEGGIPLVLDGKIVGAIGVSGDTNDHDGKCAQAGADAVR